MYRLTDLRASPGGICIKLNGETVEVNSLSQSDISRCFELMRAHYDNVNSENFLNDLREKKWAILLRDTNKNIQGFSTQTLLDLTLDGAVIKGIYSGDTIINKDFWGDTELARQWAMFAFSLARQYECCPVYWFLISKGYKTYRFLPTYFREFYPCFDRETPEFEKRLTDTFAQARFPGRYDAQTGIIKMNGERDYLKPGVADIDEKRLKDPHVSFFAGRNPGYPLGDELVCIAKVSSDNMKPLVHRYFLKGRY